VDVILPKGFEPGRGHPHCKGLERQVQLSVRAGGVRYPVRRRWASGIAVVAEQVPELSGVVDLFEGAEHLHQYAIMGVELVGEERIFTLKRANAVNYAAAADAELGMGGAA